MRLLAAALIVAGAVIGAMVECVVPEKLIAQESQPQTAEGSPDLPTREERIKRLGSYRAKGGQDLALPEAPDSQGLAKRRKSASRRHCAPITITDGAAMITGGVSSNGS